MFAPAQVGVDFISVAATVVDHPGPLLVGALVVLVAARHWWKARRERSRKRAAVNWPAITATIEIPTVASPPAAEPKGHHVATLTYFYRNPELQIGEYRRTFATKEQAKQWGAQFKGRTVPVHVNPRDGTDSVLLESDVAGSDFGFHVPLKVGIPLKVGSPALDEMPQVISPAFRMVCGLAEIAGLAGLATSTVLLCVNIAAHGKLRPYGFYWTGGILFGICLASAILVQIHLRRTEEGRWLLRSYKRWCPGWMRWSLNLTGGSAALKPLWHLLALVHLIVPHSSRWTEQPWAQAMAPYVPYVIGCWLFFMITAFHAALLRSQEELHISVVEA